ncbi:OmpL47-type beta-barrel domain-containing protein [Lysobacter korlensis]|uniref:OmpL47-type beta-barrel domain-containing protein n=1 Tax=Lysobacter korlensis TaxID=553636 RepID=A0ABV6RYC9_9GAMM
MTSDPTSTSRRRKRTLVGAAVTGILASSVVAGAAAAAEPAAPDTHAPESTLHMPALPASGWYVNGTVSMTITATDDESGVARILYTIDGVDTSVAGDTASLAFGGDGRHTLDFAAVDVAGNREGNQSFEVPIDTTGPHFSTETPTKVFQGDVVTFDYLCVDHLSGVQDCGGSLPSGARLDTSTVGTFSVGLWGVDQAGNDNRDSFSYQVVARTSSDRTPPAVTVTKETLPSTGWYAGPTTATISATDSESEVATIFYRVDRGATQTVNAASAEVEISGDARHGLEVWAADEIGNVSPRTIHEFPIDGNAPTITVPTDVLYGLDEEAVFDYSCGDEGSGLRVCDSVYDPNAPLDTHSIGEHVIEVEAVDMAWHRTVVEFRYTVVDSEVPIVDISLPPLPASGKYDGPVEVTLHADDNLGVRELRWQLTGATTAGGTRGGAEATFTIAQPGTTTIEVVAVDVAGNSSRPQMRNITLAAVDVDPDGGGDGGSGDGGNGGGGNGNGGDDNGGDDGTGGGPDDGAAEPQPAGGATGNGDGLATTGAGAALPLAASATLLLLLGGTLVGMRRLMRR